MVRFYRHRYGGRRRKNRRRRRFLWFVMFAVFCVFAELRLPPLKAELRVAALTAHAHSCIAAVVPEYLPCAVNKSGGAETVLDANGLSAAEAEITSALQKKMSGTVRAWVPAGNLTGFVLFGGRGVKIPVRFSVESAVSVRFESTLTGAGINRTAYKTAIHINVELYTTDGEEPVSVSAVYPVYEAVLSGDVPQYGVVRAG